MFTLIYWSCYTARTDPKKIRKIGKNKITYFLILSIDYLYMIRYAFVILYLPLPLMLSILEMGYRAHKCKNCGHIKTIKTNHCQGCFDYCEGCSWKPSFGNGKAIPMNGRTYREFYCVEGSVVPCDSCGKFLEECDRYGNDDMDAMTYCRDCAESVGIDAKQSIEAKMDDDI